MKKILNIMFDILKYVLLLGAFGITLFIIVRMNARLNKSFSSVISEFIPFLLIFILYVINIIFKQDSVNDNIFYNLTSCIVFATIIVVGYRAFADKNMVLNEKYGYGVDFNYFNTFIAYMKIMLYGLSVSNVLFMIHPKEKTSKKEKSK